MPKRTDIRSMLTLGAGPIVIGQACEFDYSGARVCQALREDGCRVTLVNANSATIMAGLQLADATCTKPITPEIVEKGRPGAQPPGTAGIRCRTVRGVRLSGPARAARP